MRYFTAWINPPILPEYEKCLVQTLKVIPDLEIWTEVPKNFPWEIKGAPFWYDVDKLRVWLLATYYQDAGIWIDMDVIVNQRYEIPENDVLVADNGIEVNEFISPLNLTITDTWALGHNKNPKLFQDIVGWLLKYPENDYPFSIHAFLANIRVTRGLKVFPRHLFDHKALHNVADLQCTQDSHLKYMWRFV